MVAPVKQVLCILFFIVFSGTFGLAFLINLLCLLCVGGAVGVARATTALMYAYCFYCWGLRPRPTPCNN